MWDKNIKKLLVILWRLKWNTFLSVCKKWQFIVYCEDDDDGYEQDEKVKMKY